MHWGLRKGVDNPTWTTSGRREHAAIVAAPDNKPLRFSVHQGPDLSCCLLLECRTGIAATEPALRVRLRPNRSILQIDLLRVTLLFSAASTDERFCMRSVLAAS